LRFYLAFLSRGLPQVERGRGDLVVAVIERSWSTWRGKAIEPVIREALLRIAPDLGYLEVSAVGGWWNRQNNPEIDIVGMSTEGSGKNVSFIGSIKWHEARGLTRREYGDLVRDTPFVSGVTDATALLAVTRTGTLDEELPVTCLGPEDLLAAWTGA
jgi:hypothetical protein